MVILGVLGFFVGRVWVMNINPFGVALVAATAGEKKGYQGVTLCVLLGMFTSMDGLALIKYTLLFSVIFLTKKIQERWTSNYMMALFSSLLVGVMNMLLGLVQSMLTVNTWEVFWVSILESVAVFAIANICQWGVRFILFEEWLKVPGNEELISMLVLLVIALYGIPKQADVVFSISGTMGYLMILFFGYRFGASTGAITGAAVGILFSLSGESLVVIGISCLLGVCAGTFRKLGRVCTGLCFLLMGTIMTAFALREIYGIMELRSILSAAVIFFALPKRVAHLYEDDLVQSREDDFAIQDVKNLANHQIEDFSDAFRRLSKSFDNSPKEWELTDKEMCVLFEELSQSVCGDCINCKYCWNRHYDETEKAMRDVLWQIGRDGVISLEKVDERFRHRCRKLDEYIEKVEERIAREKVRLGWYNRIAENRRVMAEQMEEIAQALHSFTVDLNDVEESSRDYKRRIAEELKKEGVKLKKLSVKKRRGHLEVVMTGACKGNQCRTKSDIAQALYRGTGIVMMPGRETRNVLSKEESTMYFREDTRLKAITGLARVAKSGEKVSGDNYSFLELQGRGELLMVLTDGMGSGEMAYKDSGNLIESLEYLMEAGFEKKSAVRLLNTLFVVNYEGQSFATLDMTAINLHTGECEIMKNGAATTFIKHQEHVETIVSSALPVGVDLDAEPDVTRVMLEEGDTVIMVSDGVLDGFYEKNMNGGEQEDMSTFIENLACQNPNELANQILMNALARSTREATDDMSVLVAGIWNKN